MLYVKQSYRKPKMKGKPLIKSRIYNKTKLLNYAKVHFAIAEIHFFIIAYLPGKSW